jgi:hypothetical protein
MDYENKLLHVARVSGRTYYFNLRKTRKGAPYLKLNIQQEDRELQSITVFKNELVDFMEGVTKTYEEILGLDHEEPEPEIETSEYVNPATKEEPKEDTTCPKCGTDDWELYPGRGVKCNGCGKEIRF